MEPRLATPVKNGFPEYSACIGLRSWSGYRRHRTERAYGCFLPDLTRFTADPCIGPDHDRSLLILIVTDNRASLQRWNCGQKFGEQYATAYRLTGRNVKRNN